MWPNPQETADLVTFTEEILNEKLDFLCRVYYGTLEYQLPHTRFDQISDHKHDISLHEKLSTKILGQAAN